MNCCQCQGIEEQFNQKLAERELQKYRKKGPGKPTRILLEAIQTSGVEGLTLLDIGGGVGAIQSELFKSGLSQATEVEGSSAYLEAAKKEAERQGYLDEVNFIQGDFVEMVKEIPSADIVTLDKVICCYPDLQTLVGLSSQKAGKIYGVIYPVDTWWMKFGVRIPNFFFKIKHNPFRLYVHPTQAIEALIRKSGLKRKFYCKLFMWHVAVYQR
ncbi:MAG: methyltransferase domain-containing protein [Caldithrix sp.]|nr:MAG: methyltransferase domain-containing protein [Caldithrix sp.]